MATETTEPAKEKETPAKLPVTALNDPHQLSPATDPSQTSVTSPVLSTTPVNQNLAKRTDGPSKAAKAEKK